MSYLVQHSLQTCDLTVVSIFVNPAQFAPTEDLAQYPRTVQADIKKLSDPSLPGKVNALFLPPVSAMYPTGIQQDVSKQVGTFVEVKGFSHQMEGASRPTFFRGVATVVLKLFNIIQPNTTFFGQKDVQQCFVLRQMLRDLHLAYPSVNNMIIVPTLRDLVTGLALSSRNAYLTPEEYKLAPVLYEALQATATSILSTSTCLTHAEAIKKGLTLIEESSKDARSKNVRMELIYINLNDPHTLDLCTKVESSTPVIISAAMWCGKTRLIDNLVLNYKLNTIE